MGFGDGGPAEEYRRGGGEEARYLVLLDGGRQAYDKLAESFGCGDALQRGMLSTTIRPGLKSRMILFMLIR